MSWVAYSRRPLMADELTAAVWTKAILDQGTDSHKPRCAQLSLENTDDVLDLCRGLLTIYQDGTVHFVHDSVRSFVLSPDMQSLDPREAREVHEMMTAVCLTHLACTRELLIFKPWISTSKTLLREVPVCHLKDYSTIHWYQHFKLAESSVSSVSALLHKTLQNAFKTEQLDLFGTVDSLGAVEFATERSLQFCAAYDLHTQASIYLGIWAQD
jgi:hypothetical protein